MQTGDLPRSLAVGQAMVDEVAPLGDYFALGTLTSNFVLALTLAGQTPRARALMRPIVQSVRTAPDVDVVGFQVAMGLISLRDGDREEALTWFRRGLRRLDRAPVDWTAARCIAGAIESLRRLGRVDEAADLLDRGDELAGAFDSPQLRADLDTQRAHLVAGSDPAAAFDLHHRALQERHDGGLRTFEPDSLEALVALTTTGQPTAQAARLLAASTSARSAMGLPRSSTAEAECAAVARQLEDVLGEREFADACEEGALLSLDDAVALARRGRGRRERPSSGWTSLTPTESDVVRLVAAGLSNAEIGERLFMSRSTVKAHLAHVFGKLDVANRVELTAVATTHGISPRAATS